jgi:A/G-specific adenine glycosylase
MASYTQGLMDLGATVCTLRRPRCPACPLQDSCVAARQGDAQRYPVKTRRLQRSQLTVWLLHAVDGQGRVWLQPRPDQGIWAGLQCLPQYDSQPALMASLPAPAHATVRVHAPFRHVLTHRDLDIHIVSALLAAEAAVAPGGAWHPPAQALGLGLPAPVRRFLAQDLVQEAAGGAP